MTHVVVGDHDLIEICEAGIKPSSEGLVYLEVLIIKVKIVLIEPSAFYIEINCLPRSPEVYQGLASFFKQLAGQQEEGCSIGFEVPLKGLVGFGPRQIISRSSAGTLPCRLGNCGFVCLRSPGLCVKRLN